MHFDFSMQLRKRIDEEKLLPRSPEVPKSRWKCNQVLLKGNSRMGHFSKGFLDQEQVCTILIRSNSIYVIKVVKTSFCLLGTKEGFHDISANSIHPLMTQQHLEHDKPNEK